MATRLNIAAVLLTCATLAQASIPARFKPERHVLRQQRVLLTQAACEKAIGLPSDADPHPFASEFVPAETAATATTNSAEHRLGIVDPRHYLPVIAQSLKGVLQTLHLP